MKEINSTNFTNSFLASSKIIDGPLYNFKEIFKKYKLSNSENNFKTFQIGISELKSWHFDSLNNFVHESGKFFKLIGINNFESKSGILLQDEVGTLGVLVCEIDGIAHFLIQLKKEPGNLIQSQLSPTLQATLSNQTRKHGGSAPKYLEKFQNINKNNTIFNKKLPEQGGIYWQKFNNNIILRSNYFKESENFMWMTLGQIYKFSEIDNSINSCLRSVLSLINLSNQRISKTNLLNKVNSIKSKHTNYTLENSVIEFYNTESDMFEFNHCSTNFQINGLNIEISGREVSSWNQPIILQNDLLSYIFIKIKYKNKNYFLLNIEEMPGYKDYFLFGPVVVTKKNKESVLANPLLADNNTKLVKELEMSEEGGRFYNLNVKHSFYENLDIKNFNLMENQVLVSIEDIHYLNKLGFLTMEGRSMLFFSNIIYNQSY